MTYRRVKFFGRPGSVGIAATGVVDGAVQPFHTEATETITETLSVPKCCQCVDEWRTNVAVAASMECHHDDLI